VTPSLLTFLTVPAEEVRPGAVRHVLAIDGRPWDQLLPDLGVESALSPIIADPAFADHNRRYLRNLLGERGDDGLRDGRIALGYCPVCGDGSCGSLLAAAWEVTEAEVAWVAIGWEEEHFGEFGPAGEVIPPREWWTPRPFEPEVTFRFDRKAYEEAIAAEIRSLPGVT
jgi:hypothetical protein